MPSKFEYIIRCWFWALSRVFVWVFIRRRFHFVTVGNPQPMPKPPFIVVANHANFFDPWIVGCHSRHALFIMMNDDGFRGNKFKAWYLRSIGAFPKKKGTHDYKAMKYTLQLLKGGFPVMIFPEGQTSWDGETQPVYSGIEKIIKRSGCPLVMMHLQGHFLSKPWWADSRREGRIEITRKILSAPTIESLSEDEILSAIKRYLYNNDIKNPINRSIVFQGNNLTAGLERLAWICRHCNAEDSLKMQDNTVTCTACSASWEMDSHFVLTPRLPTYTSIGDLYDWMHWHKKQVQQRLADTKNDTVITRNTDVIMQTQDTTGNFTNRATGVLTLSGSELCFTPTGDSSQSLHWPHDTVKDYVIQMKDIFEFRSDNGLIRFLFNRHSPMKWIYYLRYMRGYDVIEARGHY